MSKSTISTFELFALIPDEEWAWVMVSGCGVKGRLDKLKERP